MKYSILMALALSGVIYAEEYPASSVSEGQETWANLVAKIDATNDRADAINRRLDQVTICGKRGYVYAMGAVNADSDGCMAPNVNLTSINNAVSRLNTITSSMVSCNATGKAYAPGAQGADSRGCVGISPSTGTKPNTH